MSYSIIEYINRNRPEINRSIDLTLSNRSASGQTYMDGMPDPALNVYFPETGYLTLTAAFAKFRHKRPTLGYIRGTDGEVILDRDTVYLDETEIGNVTITKGVIWTESDFHVVKKIRDLQSAGGAGNQAAARELLDAYVTTPARLTESWLNTLRMLCHRVAVSGKALYTDEFSNIEVEIDYTSEIPSGNLATTKTTTGRWSQLTTADGTSDLVAHINAYYTNLRMFPAAVAMSSTEADNLLNQSSTKIKVARMKGIITDGAAVTDAANLPRPTLADVQMYIASELTSAAQGAGSPPQLIVTDAIFYKRTKAGTITSAPFVPAGYYQFMMPGYIEAARFPVVTNNYTGSLAIATERKDFPPIHEKLAVDGCGIPLVPDARWIAARNVENTAIS